MEDMILEALPPVDRDDPEAIAHAIFDVLDAKKARDIKVLKVHDQTVIADYFVICSGTSNTQINALCGAVEKALHEQAGEDPLRREGYRDGTWVLLDYGSVVIHVFTDEARQAFEKIIETWKVEQNHDESPYLFSRLKYRRYCDTLHNNGKGNPVGGMLPLTTSAFIIVCIP